MFIWERCSLIEVSYWIVLGSTTLKGTQDYELSNELSSKTNIAISMTLLRNISITINLKKKSPFTVTIRYNMSRKRTFYTMNTAVNVQFLQHLWSVWDRKRHRFDRPGYIYIYCLEKNYKKIFISRSQNFGTYI